MNETHVIDIKQIFYQLGNSLQFMLQFCNQRGTRFFFITEINGREKINKILNMCITALVDKTLFILSGAISGVSFSSFTNVIGTPVGIVSASISLVFIISKGIVKIFLKTMGKNKSKCRNIALLTRSKLSSIEKILSK